MSTAVAACLLGAVLGCGSGTGPRQGTGSSRPPKGQPQAIALPSGIDFSQPFPFDSAVDAYLEAKLLPPAANAAGAIGIVTTVGQASLVLAPVPLVAAPPDSIPTLCRARNQSYGPSGATSLRITRGSNTSYPTRAGLGAFHLGDVVMAGGNREPDGSIAASFIAPLPTARDSTAKTSAAHASSARLPCSVGAVRGIVRTQFPNDVGVQGIFVNDSVHSARSFWLYTSLPADVPMSSAVPGHVELNIAMGVTVWPVLSFPFVVDYDSSPNAYVDHGDGTFGAPGPMKQWLALTPLGASALGTQGRTRGLVRAPGTNYTYKVYTALNLVLSLDGRWRGLTYHLGDAVVDQMTQVAGLAPDRPLALAASMDPMPGESEDIVPNPVSCPMSKVDAPYLLMLPSVGFHKGTRRSRRASRR
jgi:hypothetical protein